MTLLLDQLASRQLLIVTGKGGVGKSSLTATLGLILARTGRRVLLLEVDPRESLYQLLGLPPLGGKVSRAARGLRVQNLRPAEVVDELVRERLKFDFLAERVLASPVYRHFTAGAPGLEQLAVLGYAQRVVRGEAGPDLQDVDIVILDSPATGHGLAMLAAPALVSEVIREGPIGELASQLAELTGDAGRCGVAVVSWAEEMPVTETIELIASLDRRLGRRPEMVVVNGIYPRLEGRPGDEDELRAAHELWRRRRAVNERELKRLGDAWTGPLIELPLVPHSRGPGLVAALRGRLELALTERQRARPQ